MTGGSRIVLILGDQLSKNIASLRYADKKRDRVLLAEVFVEATYVRHHKKKIALAFSAMRHFAKSLQDDGWFVDYVVLDDPANTQSLGGEVQRHARQHSIRNILLTEPGEWRLMQDIGAWSHQLDLNVEILPDDRFLCSRTEFSQFVSQHPSLRLETFYRMMRRKTGLLMDGERPAGGKWNFDKQNRKRAQRDLLMPRPSRFANDTITNKVLRLVEARFADHFGDLRPFWFATTADQAEIATREFIERALPFFGDFQDAMLSGEKFLYHSVLSIYMNLGLLDPLNLCRQVEIAYRDGRVPINAAEGFIRQIIGWREFVRGVYWEKMPAYEKSNCFSHRQPLPDFYWTGETEMACVRQVVVQTKEEAYAHHIQRLMVTGNFALLAGLHPRQLHQWYLIVYADAYEWVEMPNTIGMSQYADGGFLASKPYIATGGYINRMSDYCGRCTYDVSKRQGPKACPFNTLYWDFLARNEQRLSGNPRMALALIALNKIDATELRKIRQEASAIRAALPTSGDPEKWPPHYRVAGTP